MAAQNDLPSASKGAGAEVRSDRDERPYEPVTSSYDFDLATKEYPHPPQQSDLAEGADSEDAEPTTHFYRPTDRPPWILQARNHVIKGPLIGTPYLVIRKIADGGMAEVFEAKDVDTEERAVVKLLRKEHLTEEMIDRLRFEAESLASLDHPNVVRVLHFSQNLDGQPCLATEQLLGRTLLEELLAFGPFPIETAVDCARQVLAGLRAVHAIGIVHRDVKLENLFLCDPAAESERRVVKILDFGLARIATRIPGVRAPAPLAYPTREGVLVGTPRYSAPEQNETSSVDQRADIYSAGTVLYALLLGSVPFADIRNDEERLREASRRGIDLSWMERRGPEMVRLRPILARALAVDPKDRFQTVEEFEAALAAEFPDREPQAEARSNAITKPDAPVVPPNRAPDITSRANIRSVLALVEQHAAKNILIAMIVSGLSCAAITAVVLWLVLR